MLRTEFITIRPGANGYVVELQHEGQHYHHTMPAVFQHKDVGAEHEDHGPDTLLGYIRRYLAVTKDNPATAQEESK